MEFEAGMSRYIIGSNQTRFAVLADLFEKINIRGYDGITFIIDGNAIFRKFYRERKNVNAILGSRDAAISDMTVGFMNVIGHYRRFAAMRLGMPNRVYATFNRTSPTFQTSLVPEFHSTRAESYDFNHPVFGFLNMAISKSWEFVMNLSPYFEGVYCLNSRGVDDYALAYEFVITRFPNDLKVIISDSRYSYQLTEDPGVIQLHPRRDESFLVTKENCYKRLLTGTKIIPDERLTPGILPIAFALSGLKELSVKRLDCVTGIGGAVRTLGKMAADGAIKPGMSIGQFLEEFGDYSRVSLKPLETTIRNRYRAMSIPLAAKAITADQSMLAASGIFDIYDQNAMEELNDILAGAHLNPEILEIENLNMSSPARWGR